MDVVPHLGDNVFCLILCLSRDVAFTLFFLSRVSLHKQNSILFMCSVPASIWVSMVGAVVNKSDLKHGIKIFVK